MSSSHDQRDTTGQPQSLTEISQSNPDAKLPLSGVGRSPSLAPLPTLHPLDEKGWLATQPQAFREWVAKSGRWRMFGKGEALYEIGEEPMAVFGLGDGALDVLIPVSDDDQVTIHRAEPGFWIGDSGLLAGTRRVMSVVAASKSRVFCLLAAPIRRLLGEHPECWRCFYELNHRNATLCVTTLAEVLTFSPEVRLARIILRLADAHGEVHITQTDLARLLGVTRSSLQRALGHIHDAGLVRTAYGTVAIDDRQKLQRVADAV